MPEGLIERLKKDDKTKKELSQFVIDEKKYIVGTNGVNEIIFMNDSPESHPNGYIQILNNNNNIIEEYDLADADIKKQSYSCIASQLTYVHNPETSGGKKKRKSKTMKKRRKTKSKSKKRKTKSSKKR